MIGEINKHFKERSISTEFGKMSFYLCSDLRNSAVYELKFISGKQLPEGTAFQKILPLKFYNKIGVGGDDICYRIIVPYSESENIINKVEETIKNLEEEL